MALIQMSHTWPDGANLTITISGKARYPDAVSDLTGSALRLWRDALAEMNEPTEPSDDDAEFAALTEDEETQ